MNPVHAIVLGAVQGLAEFVPISSSAHLAILHRFFGDTSNNLFFDVMLHTGTLVALILYFWRDWLDMFRAKFEMNAGKEVTPEKAALGRLLIPVVLACIPGALVGARFGDRIEHSFDQHPLAIALTMGAMGLLLWLADRKGSSGRVLEKITTKDWVSIGLAQAFAIIPGVSRSGVTITAGLFSGLTREAAARFSFLLGTPIILGAAAHEAIKYRHDFSFAGMSSMLLGMASAAIVGYLCIGFLLKYLHEKNVGIFVAYRLLFAAVVVLLIRAGFLH